MVDLTNSNQSLQEVLDSVEDGETILLAARVYNEKIKVRKKNITLLGQEGSCICYNASHGTIIPKDMGGDGVKCFGTTGSATVTIAEGADYFTARNIIFMNSFKRNGGKKGQAVAFKSEIHHLTIDNCSFISEQDTLYIDYGRENVIKNSHIEGDVDFIFGSADCFFVGCDIVAKKVSGVAYYIAPDTFISNAYGFVFKDCSFTAEEGVQAYLGRAWFPNKAREKVFPRATLVDCSFKGNNILELIQMHEGDSREFGLCLKRCEYLSKTINYEENCTFNENILRKY